MDQSQTNADLTKRLELQSILEDVLGSRNVYFQPPVNVKLSYPCIIYQRSAYDNVYANNDSYRHKKQYMVTIIDRDPDSDIPRRVSRLPYTRFSRNFVSDSLNHDVFDLFY